MQQLAQIAMKGIIILVVLVYHVLFYAVNAKEFILANA